MAATYDPDPRAPLCFRIPFNAESEALIEERRRNWRRHEEFDGSHSDIDYRMDVSLPFLTRVLK